MNDRKSECNFFFDILVMFLEKEIKNFEVTVFILCALVEYGNDMYCWE